MLISMWITHSLLVASVLMMLHCTFSGGHPQSVTPVAGLPDDDDEFIKLLGANNGSPNNDTCSDQRECVPFHQCCDPLSTTADPIPDQDYDFPIDAYRTIDINEHKNSPCEDIISICCETLCEEDTIATTTPITPDMRHDPSAHCGSSKPRSFIVRNFKDNQAQYGEFPWMVAVMKKDTTFIGGGSLVHNRIVLTAAHKVHNQNKNNLVVRIGDWDLSSATEPDSSQELNVEKIVVHPDFQRRTHENNVALLILQKDAEYSDTVMPVCLPQPGQEFAGAKCFVTGWGKDVFGETGRYQSIMKKKALPVVNNSDCERRLQETRLGSTFRLDSSFICAGGASGGACTGDGGSPLVCPNPNNPSVYIQAGIVSWGITCGKGGSPSVFASVSKTVNWINETIGKEGGFSVIEFEHRTKLEH